MRPTRLLSIDPGLDAVAVAEWDLGPAQPTGALRAVHRFTTDPAHALPQRLAALGADLFGLIGWEALATGKAPTVVVVEMPGAQAIYGRNAVPGRMKAVVTSMLASSLATGAILLTAQRHAAACLASPTDTTRKADKQRLGAAFLKSVGLLTPPKPRRAWSDDERDAVYIGLHHYHRARLLVAHL